MSKLNVTLMFTVLALVGCASGPELDNYPLAEIDRPYTLPDNVKRWNTLVYTVYEKDRTGSSFLPPIPIPLSWDVALSDTWTLHWSPLPLSASHQLSRSENHVAGLTFGLAAGYGSDAGAILAPLAGGYYRRKLGPAVALEISPGASAYYHSKGRPWNWSAGLGVGPLFQLTSNFSVNARFTPGVSYGRESAVVDSSSSTLAHVPYETRFTLPVGVGANWNFSKQWNLSADYSYSRIGKTNDYTRHAGVVTISHLW